MRKAQVQAITLVLISGIVISLVGFAYTWGKPMIDKRTVVTQYTSGLRFMEDLDSKIVDMAGTCSFEGACEEIISLPVSGVISLNTSNNTITYEFTVIQPLITDGEILFNTADDGEYVRYGETPGVISLTGEKGVSNLFKLRFRLHYRELDRLDPSKGYKIELTGSGAMSGTNKISISYEGSETHSGMAYNGGDLIVSKIKVQPM